ncbi:hypothetical protein PoB_006386900 [Plakobranchus ocellatus]|uniref:Uncharacterized protein n=1 Tax=Plakobranchus ocellatus TaxID=259542 RepID=A0AAV4CZN5_9GAST|nr:hypothetical protein PoB_006386900 [Plakobranchus ocellatus]
MILPTAEFQEFHSAFNFVDIMTYLIMPFHNKVISGFLALRQARAPVEGLEQKDPCRSQASSLSTVPPPPLVERVLMKSKMIKIEKNDKDGVDDGLCCNDIYDYDDNDDDDFLDNHEDGDDD